MKPEKNNVANILLVCAAVLVALSLVIYALTRQPKSYGSTFFAMGTYINATVYGAEIENELKNAVDACENEMSHRIPTSAVALINDGESVKVSDRLDGVLKTVLKLRDETDGAFDVCVLDLTSLWDFDSGLHNVPSASDIEKALALAEKCGISENGGMWSGSGVDLGSVGKGAACDACAEVLRENGASGIVAVGGSIACVGEKPSGKWNVAVRDPFGKDSVDALVTLSLGECFVSTSGSYEKSFVADGVTYHHILSTSTGYPAAGDIVSVTVICSQGALSDALSTAFFLLGEEKSLALAKEYSAQALFVRADGTVFATSGLKGVISADGDTEIVYASDS